MLVLKVFDETSFPVDLEGTVHTAVVVVFMLHLLMLLQVSLLCGRVGAEITLYQQPSNPSQCFVLIKQSGSCG